jgi:hypothetical protein
VTDALEPFVRPLVEAGYGWILALVFVLAVAVAVWAATRDRREP